MDLRQAIGKLSSRRDMVLLGSICIISAHIESHITTQGLAVACGLSRKKMQDVLRTLQSDNIINVDSSRGNQGGIMMSWWKPGKKNLLVTELKGEMTRAEKMSAYLHKRLIQVHGDTKTLREAKADIWVKECDAILRIDKRPSDEVLSVIEFALTDTTFWADVIQSPKSLRKNYDKILVKVRVKKPGVEIGNWLTPEHGQ